MSRGLEYIRVYYTTTIIITTATKKNVFTKCLIMQPALPSCVQMKLPSAFIISAFFELEYKMGRLAGTPIQF